jgi:hypothetical protein
MFDIFLGCVGVPLALQILFGRVPTPNIAPPPLRQERKIPHRVAPIDPEEACRAYEAMLARVHEELQNAPPNESLTAFEAMQRYQRMLKNGARR